MKIKTNIKAGWQDGVNCYDQAKKVKDCKACCNCRYQGKARKAERDRCMKACKTHLD